MRSGGRPCASLRPGCRRSAARGAAPDTAAGGTSPGGRRGQVEAAALGQRGETVHSVTDTSSIRSPSSCTTLANPDLIRDHACRSDRDRTAISTTASAAVGASSTSTNTVRKRPSSFSRRSNSRTRLVLPIRRCAVSSVWWPLRTRSVSAASSASRSKKRSPSTQFAPAFCSPAISRLPTPRRCCVRLQEPLAAEAAGRSKRRRRTAARRAGTGPHPA